MLKLRGLHAISPAVQSKDFRNDSRCRTFKADRVFDGEQLLPNGAVIIKRGRIIQSGSSADLTGLCLREFDLGDATILPGFIESHAHMNFQKVPHDVVLQHGVTTVRDTGGPLLAPTGGKGSLRLLSAGPIIQATGGYPNNVFGGGGEDDHHSSEIVAFEADTADEGRHLVRHFAEAGAVVIKIALEVGGEHGAPWSGGHGHGAGPATPWPIMDQDTTNAIVDEAHKLGLKVTAHVGENTGVRRALDAGVDEFAHIPCAEIDHDLLHRAVEQGVVMVTTLDTLSSCAGIDHNTHHLAHIGAELSYNQIWCLKG